MLKRAYVQGCGLVMRVLGSLRGGRLFWQFWQATEHHSRGASVNAATMLPTGDVSLCEGLTHALVRSTAGIGFFAASI